MLIECKFKDDPVDSSIIDEIERKIKALKLPSKVTLEKVLITANGVQAQVEKEDYFHKILTLDDLLP